MAATKKKANKPKKGKPQTKKKSGGFAAFVKSKRFAHIRGALYVMFAFFLLVSLAGYYATGCDPTRHWLKALGYGTAEFFAVKLFGIGSLGFSLLFFVYGMRLWDVRVLPWWKTFGSTVFWMFWLSLTLGYVAVKWLSGGVSFEQYAGVGLTMAQPLEALMGWWTLVLLLMLAVAVLVIVHKMELPKVDFKKAVEELENVATENKNDYRKEDIKAKSPRSQRKAADGDVIDLNAEDEASGAEEEEDEGADFDEAAMKLFSRHPGDEHSEAETDDGEADNAEESPVVESEPAFNIDDEFARINAKARGEAIAESGSAVEKEDEETSDGVTFTIEGFDDSTPLPTEETPAGEVEEPLGAECDENGEPLDEDDYRRHIGLDEAYDPHLDLGDYIMPDTSILEDWETANVRVTKEELVANKDRIVQTLKDYGIEITDISAIPGPTVTLYKIKPAPGVRISKIKNLEDDIALSLAALGIRIIAPIPGESNVGIEVPNAKPQIVAMKTMLESEAFEKAREKMELPIAFGKTISNECFVTDLAKMPHLLMAGATGTGKSVGLNAVLASLLYTKHPSELKMVLVDPKKVEFSLYSALEHHYLAKMPDEEEAVITDVKKVVRTLNSLCIEMDSRYDLLKAAKVRKITEYNDKFCKRMLNPEKGHRYLPYIVVVIDEFGDLIMTAGKEVELPIARLAQLARAVGIHLIIATQRPTTNIITGTIKANFPARVAFRVTSGIDSKTILDTGGAQQLIGRGDMLISLAGKDMIRLQCALIDTPEIEKLVKFIGDQRGYPDGFELPEYLDENEEPNMEFDAKHKDEFFEDAARLVVASQFGSTSLLQRKLQLGYNRAGRIIDQLEAAGIVGPSNGSKPRDVLVHDEMSLEGILRSL